MCPFNVPGEDAVLLLAEAVPVGVRLRGAQQRDGAPAAAARPAAPSAAAAPEHLPGELLVVPADLPDLRDDGARGPLPARVPRLHERVSAPEGGIFCAVCENL